MILLEIIIFIVMILCVIKVKYEITPGYINNKFIKQTHIVLYYTKDCKREYFYLFTINY